MIRTLGLLLLFALGSRPLIAKPDPHFATGAKAIAATNHPLATEAAIKALKRGGNAIDGAVAAALTLGVVDGYNSGIGGGCFMLLRLADGRILALDGREMAPAAATRDMFLRNGKADPSLSRTGSLAIGIPGSLMLYDQALRKHGRLKLAEHLANAAKIAEEGFILNSAYANRIRATSTLLKQFPASAEVFLDDSGVPLTAGSRLIQTDLAKTYQMIATEGIGSFYGGSFARTVADWMRDNKGLITVDDFKNYRTKAREPIDTSYRGYRITGFPPPSSGGVHVAQILNILEEFDLKAMPPWQRAHVIAESMKLAFADRAHWLGDSDFAKVPKNLISKEYSKSLASGVALDRSTEVSGYSTPPASDTNWFGEKHTTHFCVADAEGNWVACTATVNTTFGSKVIVPGTGVILNNQMDDFSAQPGVPNAFGLVGAEANAVAPGKRPLSSMSPTIVLKDGKPIFSVGAAGGPTIITQVVMSLIHRLDFEKDLQTCLSAARIHHQWRPNRLKLELGHPDDICERLRELGHTLDHQSAIGVSQAMALTKDGKLEGMTDPRAQGMALGW